MREQRRDSDCPDHNRGVNEVLSDVGSGFMRESGRRNANWSCVLPTVRRITLETSPAHEPFAIGADGRTGAVYLRATIADNGVGGADPSAGSGLTGLADRVEALGGRFALDTPSGRGTRISIELPLAIR